MERSVVQRRTLRAMVTELKGDPCTDCGQRFPPYVMQFDHVRGTKVKSVSALLLDCNKAKLLAEIDKCELVCANCHAVRTWARRHPEEFDN